MRQFSAVIGNGNVSVPRSSGSVSLPIGGGGRPVKAPGTVTAFVTTLPGGQLTLGGTADPDNTITVQMLGGSQYTTTSDASGNWSLGTLAFDGTIDNASGCGWLKITASNAHGSRVRPQPVAPPMMWGTLTLTRGTQNADGTYNYALSYSGAWNVDVGGTWRVTSISPAAGLNGLSFTTTRDASGRESLSANLVAAADQGQTFTLDFVDSWGLHHRLTCTVS